MDVANELKIIVVCGMNHSGTSCVAEFLLKNGADPGAFEKSFDEITPYVKYENILFKIKLICHSSMRLDMSL